MAKVYVDAGDGGRWEYHIRDNDLKFVQRTLGKFASRDPIEAIPASSKEQRFADQLARVRRHWDTLVPLLRKDLIERIQTVWARPASWFFDSGNTHYRADINNANQAYDSYLSKSRQLGEHLEHIQTLGQMALKVVAQWEALIPREKATLGRLLILHEHMEEKLSVAEGIDAQKYMGEALDGVRYGDLKELVMHTYANL